MGAEVGSATNPKHLQAKLVLRSLSQWQLSLSVEEGLCVGLREWHHTSN